MFQLLRAKALYICIKPRILLHLRDRAVNQNPAFIRLTILGRRGKQMRELVNCIEKYQGEFILEEILKLALLNCSLRRKGPLTHTCMDRRLKEDLENNRWLVMSMVCRKEVCKKRQGRSAKIMKFEIHHNGNIVCCMFLRQKKA